MQFPSLLQSLCTACGLRKLHNAPLRCSRGHALEDVIVRRLIGEARSLGYCSDCGEGIWLNGARENDTTLPERQSIGPSPSEAQERELFEQAIQHVRQQAQLMGEAPPSVFLSYAWGVEKHERWLQERLAPDLEQAGVRLFYDRHENVLVGSDIHAFIDRIATSNKIVVVGTPLYLKKSNNEYSESGSILALEKIVIYEQILRSKNKRKVLPILLDGEKHEALPPLLQGFVPADFRDNRLYQQSAFKLILSIYDMPLRDPVVSFLHDALKG